MTRKRCLKMMRRLFPSIAGREAYARRHDGVCEVGIELHSGEGGYRGKREPVISWRASTWESCYAKAHALRRS